MVIVDKRVPICGEYPSCGPIMYILSEFLGLSAARLISGVESSPALIKLDSLIKFLLLKLLNCFFILLLFSFIKFYRHAITQASCWDLPIT